MAVRRAVRHLSMESFEKIERMYHELYPVSQSGNLESYLHLEWLFRLEIYRIGSAERFLREIQAFRELSERYLRFAYTFSDSLSDSYAMHKKILDAIGERNVDQAEFLVQEALRWTLKTAGPVIDAHLRHSTQQKIE